MTGQWTEVDTYFEDMLIGVDPVLREALDSSHAAGLPPIAVSPMQGRFLELLVRMTGARRILEIGTLGGYSAICMARALPEDGRLVTLEISPRHAEVARANFARAGLAERIELRLGPAAESLKRLSEERAGPFDLVFVDADKPSNAAYIEAALSLSHPGTVIVCDNVVRNGAVADKTSTDPNVIGSRRAIALLADRTRFAASALQTVGSKGYDGFAIALVK